MKKLSFREYARRFLQYSRSRAHYFYAFLPINLCKVWMHGLGQAVLVDRGTVAQYLAKNIFDSVISSLVLAIWVFAAFQRIYSMGVPAWAAPICTAAMTALGGWAFTTQTHEYLAFCLLLLAQLPLMTIKRRADRDILRPTEVLDGSQQACNPSKS